MKLIFSAPAAKALRKMPRREADALMAKLETVAAAPFAPYSWAKRLVSSPAYRAREGEWRAVYRLDKATDEMIVDAVAHRREIYK